MRFDSFELRLFQASDADAFFQLIDRNRPRLEDFFSGTVARTRTLQDTRDYGQEIMKRIEARSYYPHMLLDRDPGEPVGFIDVKNIDWNIPKGELGCFMDQRYEGQGVAYRAMQLLIHRLLEEWGFQKLFLRTSAANASANALARKCGFQQEGILRSDYKTTQGELVDLVYYGLVKTEYVPPDFLFS